MRVREGEGEVGVGWGLSAGGQVTRMLRGLPDDYNPGGSDLRKGWLFNSNAQQVQNFTSLPDDNLSVSTDEQAAYTFLEGRAYTQDTEPDLFVVSAPGLSVQFVFGTDGLPKLLAYQDIDITVTRPGGTAITEFIIKTPAGLIYTFSTLESVERKSTADLATTGAPLVPTYNLSEFSYYQQACTYTGSWHLTSITSLSSNSVATITYTTGEQVFVAKEVWNRETPLKRYYVVTEKRSNKQLQGMTLGTNSITFEWNENLLSKASLLETESGENKYFTFHYFAAYQNNDSYPRLHRYFLKEIKPQVNCIPAPAYEFKYDQLNYASPTGIDPPISTGEQEDRWGYYTHNLYSSQPSVLFHSASSDAARFTISPPGTGGTNIGVLPRWFESVGLNYCTFGALSEISYPTGGVTKIAWESNTYFDAILNATVQGGGARVKSLTSYGGEQAYNRNATDQPASHAVYKEYKYTLSDGTTTSGKLTYPALFYFATRTSFLFNPKNAVGEPSEVLYSRTEEVIPTRGKTVFEYNLPGMYPSLTDGNWKATKSYIARNVYVDAGNLKNGSYTYPHPPHTNYNLDRGTLASVKVYAEGNILMSQRTITYARNPSTPLIVYGIRFEKLDNIYHFGKYEVLTGLGLVVTQEVVQEASEQTTSALRTTTTTNTYTTTLPVLLRQTTTTQADGSIARQTFKYAGDYAITTPSGDAAQAIFELNNTTRKTQLIESASYYTPAGGTEAIAGASLVLFKKFGTYVLPNKTYSSLATTGFTESTVTGSPQQFSFNTSYYRLSQTIEGYTVKGQPLDIVDDNYNRISHHYSNTKAIGPVASFANAKSNQTGYEGFEEATGFGISLSGATATYVAGWTGTKALQLPVSPAKLVRSGLEKPGVNSMRISCWVKASTAATLTFKAYNGGTEVSGSTTTLSYTAAMINQWNYLEATMNITNAPATYSIEATSNAAVTIDDVLLIPANASSSLTTYSPLNGATSQTDNRGNSSLLTFDLFGRVVNTFDRKRNVTSKNEYATLKAETSSVIATIQSTASFFVTQQAYTFNAGPNCQSGVTFEWSINGGPVLSTSSSFNNTFPLPGNYTVTLKVSHPQASSYIYHKDVCVVLNPTYAPAIVIENVSGITNPPPDQIVECLNTYTKRLSISNVVCSDGISDTDISWHKYNPSSGFWDAIGQGAVIEHTFGGANQLIRCTMNVLCTQSLVQCDAGVNRGTEAIISLTYITNGPCQ